MSSKDMHGITALTFNSNQADLIYKVIGNALVAQQNTWQTLLKALILVDHLVRYGAECCVDKSWDLTMQLERLEQYNSAMIKSSFGTKGGRDNGEPVRTRAKLLVSLLESDDKIRCA